MTTRHGFPDLKIELDGASGGSLTNISAFVTEISGWSKEAIVQEITAAGDDDDRWAFVGIRKKAEITLTGPYDDVSDGLVAITKAHSALGETRTLQLTFDGTGATDVETVECIIIRVERSSARDQLHNYMVTLRPTGDIT